MKFRRVVAVTVMVFLFVGGAGAVALAEPSGSPREAGQRQNPPIFAVLAYVAGKSGASLDALVAEFKQGKSLEEIAAEHGVDWAAVEEVFGRKGFDKDAMVQRLEERLARLAENRSKLEEHLARLEERVAQLEERISGMEDEVMKGFALRLLDILRERLSLGQERTVLMDREIELVRDMLEYVRTL